MRSPGTSPADRARVVIPVFDHATLTATCLDTVLGLYPGIEIVVVDDGSTDRTADLLSTFDTQITVVRHAEHRGFARAGNSGAAGADREFLLFLDNGTIPHDGVLEGLVDAADSHAVAGVFGAKLLNPDGTVGQAGLAVDQRGLPLPRLEGLAADHPAVDKARVLQMLAGACMFVRRAVFEEVGGFDTSIWPGFEGPDLCLRARTKGHLTRYVPAAVSTHHAPMTPDGVAGDAVRGHQEFTRRYGDTLERDDLSLLYDDRLLDVDYQESGRIRIAVDPAVGSVMGAVLLDAEEHADAMTERWLRARRLTTAAAVDDVSPLNRISFDDRMARQDGRQGPPIIRRASTGSAADLTRPVPVLLGGGQGGRVNLLVDGVGPLDLLQGDTVALELAAFLSRLGYRVRLIGLVNAGVPSGDVIGRMVAREGLAELRGAEFLDLSRRDRTLSVSRDDRFVVTSWYGMVVASGLAARLGAPAPIWIQDRYEPADYPAGSLAVNAERAYALAHHAVTTSDLLHRHCRIEGIGAWSPGAPGSVVRMRPPVVAAAPADHPRPVPRGLLLDVSSHPGHLADTVLGALGVLRRNGAIPEGWRVTTFGDAGPGRSPDPRPVDVVDCGRGPVYRSLLETHGVGVALRAGPEEGAECLDMVASGLQVVTSVRGPAKTELALRNLSPALHGVDPTEEDVARRVAALISDVEDGVALPTAPQRQWPTSPFDAYDGPLATVFAELLATSRTAPPVVVDSHDRRADLDAAGGVRR